MDTSATLTQVTPIPSRISREKALALVQDAEHHIRSDADMKFFSPWDLQIPVKLPSDIPPAEATKVYMVTDSVPASFGHHDAASYNEYTRTDDGMFVHSIAPMGVMLDTRWRVGEAQDGGLEMVAVVEIKCSKLMIGTVKKSRRLVPEIRSPFTRGCLADMGRNNWDPNLHMAQGIKNSFCLGHPPPYLNIKPVISGLHHPCLGWQKHRENL